MKVPDTVHLNVFREALPKGLKPLGRPELETRAEVAMVGWKRARTLNNITNKMTSMPTKPGEG